MSRLKEFVTRNFISDEITFESRTLNFVCFFSAVASTIALILRFVAKLPFISAVPLFFMIIAILAVLYVSIKRGKNAKLLTTIILFGVIIIFWPFLFFTNGGAHSGMSVYFALAIILDFTLLKGKPRVCAIIATSIVTVICYVSTLYLGWEVLPEGGFDTSHLFIDLMQSIFIVGFLMGLIVLFQMRLFRNQSNIVEAAYLERNESVKQLKTAQLTVSSMFEVNPHINLLFDSSFTVVDCNPAAIKFMRFNTKEELLNGFLERITKSIPPFQSNGRPSIPLPERFMAVVKEGEVKFETDIVFDDETRTLDVEFKRIPYGESFAIVGYVYDMTEIHEREMELKRAHELNDLQLKNLNLAVANLEVAQQTVSAMFESNPHINILFNSRFEVIDCNPAAVGFMGFETKEEFLVGFADRLAGSIPDVLSTGREKRPIAEYFVVAAKEGFVKLETELMLSGSVRTVNIELKRIPYGDSYAIVGYILDMTEVHAREMELKRRDQLLSEAVEAAETANKAKSAFLSTMSHEIRTPMNAILGITEIQLQNEGLDDHLREAFEKVYTSGDLLLGIINDILDLSKIESGKLELVIDKYEIASLISDTAQLNMMRIGSKPIEFELDVDENTPVTVMGDELRVKQILNNVLSNAFKYTASGTVKLSIYADNSIYIEDTVILVLSISDTGQGMTEEQVSRLFDEYSRFNTEANRATEGTGLGMSITRNLVSLMDGELSVESTPGVGSVFTIRIPQGKSGTNLLGQEMAENLRQFRTSSRAQMKRVQITREPMPYGNVLIVDDVETNIYVAKGLLTPYELRIDSATSAYEAIEKVKNGYEYDIIFMDNMMPHMDGIEGTKRIRNMGYTHPIVALTANAVSGQADLFPGHGFDDYISKPIDVRQLNTVLNRLIRDKQTSDVLEAARSHEHNKDDISHRGSSKVFDPRFAEVFIRDAKKSIEAILAIAQRDSYADENDLRTYTIHVHGMKSALANIGRLDISAVALKLESSARDGDIAVLSSETPAFLSSVQTLVEELTPDESSEVDASTDSDPGVLRESLLKLRSECESYSKKSSRDILNELKSGVWSRATNDFIDKATEMLLHSEFDEIISEIDTFLDQY